MARIAQCNIFSWKEIEDLGDLERLQLIIKYFPDEKLMQKLEKERKNRRDDYPIRAIWNSILAGVVYQHESIESLRRELLRNGQLRDLCGFNPLWGVRAVPSKWAYSRFLRSLYRYPKEIENMFHELVQHLQKELPDFGTILVGDGKAISSHRKKDKTADFCVKKYKGINSDGTMWSKTKSWFGFRLHLIADANYELPIAYEVTRASKNEGKVMKGMVDKLAKKHKALMEKCNYALFDRGYDDEKLIKKLWDDYGIKPIIDIRNTWKDKDDTRQFPRTKNILYNYRGDVFCFCGQSGEIRSMAYGGFEKERKTLKYRCPAEHYGINCLNKNCLHRKALRVSIDMQRRLFTPLPRSTYKWKDLYKKRTSIERVNSRLDVSFGFEKHYISGLKKMHLRCGIALSVMLTIALGRIRGKRKDLMRSLISAA